MSKYVFYCFSGLLRFYVDDVAIWSLLAFDRWEIQIKLHFQNLP